MSLTDRFRAAGLNDYADKKEEEKKVNEQKTKDMISKRENNFQSVADAGTSKKEEKPTYKESTYEASNDRNDRKKDREDKNTLPDAPTLTSTTVAAPVTPYKQVSTRDTRQVERDVKDEYKPIFDQLGEINDLAAQGKTAQVDLYLKNAKDTLALYDEQLTKFEELKLNKDLTADETANLERQREELNREKLLRQNELTKAETAAQYKDNILLQAQYNEQQQVRLETFAGLKNGFGSSALVSNLENVMNEGQRALTSLRTSATQANASYANEALNIEKDYNFGMSTINTNLNAQLLSNYNDLSVATMQIMQNKLLTTQERDEKSLEAVNTYNDKIAENQLRSVSLMQQQNADVQARISQLKEDNYRTYQVDRDKDVFNYQANVDSMKYDNQIAQENYQNKLGLYTTIANIEAQEAGNNFELKQLQQQLQIHNDSLQLSKDQFEEMKTQFGEEQALSWYTTKVNEENLAAQYRLDNYKAKETVSLNNKNLVISQNEIENETARLLYSDMIKMEDAEGNDILYNPATGEYLSPEALEVEVEKNADWYYYDQAISSVLGFENANTQESVSNVVKSYYLNGDKDSARQELENSIIKTGGTGGDTIAKASLIVPLLSSLKSDLAQYYKKGGTQEIIKDGFDDIGLTEDDIMEAELLEKGSGTGRWVGLKEKYASFVQNETTDPELATLATKIAASIAAFTVTLSGAQFSDKERKEYASQFPSIWKSQELNSAKINGLLGTWNNMRRSSIKDSIPVTTYNAIWGDVIDEGTTMEDLLS